MLEAWPPTRAQSLGDELPKSSWSSKSCPQDEEGTWRKAGKQGKVTQGTLPTPGLTALPSTQCRDGTPPRALPGSLPVPPPAPGMGGAHLWARTAGGRPPAGSPARSCSGARPPPPGSGARSRRCPPCIWSSSPLRGQGGGARRARWRGASRSPGPRPVPPPPFRGQSSHRARRSGPPSPGRNRSGRR